MTRWLSGLAYLALIVVGVVAAGAGASNYLTSTRGIERGLPTAPLTVGTNVSLEQYEDAALAHALDALQRAGITRVRQVFPWRTIEAERGQDDWGPWDRIVKAAQARGIELVAVLYTAPAWSQRENEKQLPGAPPNDLAEFARFAGRFAARYRDVIHVYQVWDEPNVAPSWGERNADPVEYAQMLIPAAEAIRAAAPGAQIALAGLAMNLELHRPHPYYSEVLYLRGLYEIGANKYFDIVAAKPYGMWTGPEDRTVSSGVLNFSRLILLRDEMRQYGDGAKPVWAVELGWNALPSNWTGLPSPWGTDREPVQADRLARALERARTEWAWVTAVFPGYLQPDAPADNPRWGFSLWTPAGEPAAFFTVLAAAHGSLVRAPEAAPVFPTTLALGLALLAGVVAIASWRAWRLAGALELAARWERLERAVAARPEPVQLAALAVTALAFYASPNVALNLLLLALLALWFALRPDLAVALIVFTIPFWNYPKTLFSGFQLAPAEVFTWGAVAAVALVQLLRHAGAQSIRASAPADPLSLRAASALDATKQSGCESSRTSPFVRLLRAIRPLSALDWAVAAFLLLALASTRWAGNFGVASREFRIIVLDPVLLYGLVRLLQFSPRAYLTPPTTARLGRYTVTPLLASGVAVCAIGLAQLATGDVIVVDGVARIYGVWGSPNNVGLYLGRLLPVALALALMGPGKWARWAYAALTILFALIIYLTFSRGALFLGLPVSLIVLAVLAWSGSHRLSRRALVAAGAALVVALLALGFFLTTGRGQNLGTGFFRVAVWTSAVQMIRDHPLLGVGLDNFLYEYPKYILPEAWREPNLSHPHNVLLDFWVRLGVGGVALAAWMIAAFYLTAWRRFRDAAASPYVRALMLGLMASMADFLGHGLIDAAYFVMDLAYVFMLTLALAQLQKD